MVASIGYSSRGRDDGTSRIYKINLHTRQRRYRIRFGRKAVKTGHRDANMPRQGRRFNFAKVELDTIVIAIEANFGDLVIDCAAASRLPPNRSRGLFAVEVRERLRCFQDAIATGWQSDKAIRAVG